jgi:hypothetical protein
MTSADGIVKDISTTAGEVVASAPKAAVNAAGTAMDSALRAPGALMELTQFALAEGEDNEFGGSINKVQGAMNTSRVGAEGLIDATDITVTAKHAGNLMQKSALASASSLVERETLKLVIEENHRRFTGCLMLPLTLLFFIFYAGAASMHEDITQTHLMESPIRDKLTLMPGGAANTGDVIPGIVSVSDVWQFMQNTYIPLFFTDTSVNGVPLPVDKRGRAFMYNNLIGAAEIHTQRSAKKACEDEIADHMTCYDQKKINRSDFGRSWDEMPAGSEAYYLSGTNPIIKCTEEGFRIFPGDVGACPGTDSLVRGGPNATMQRRRP